MKHHFLFLLVLISSVVCFAEETNNDPNDKNSGKVGLRPGSLQGKRAPGAAYIEYSFSDGILTFEESSLYKILSVTIQSLETGDEWYGTVSNANPSVAYTDVPGVYSVTCISNLGQIFVGEIQQ